MAEPALTISALNAWRGTAHVLQDLEFEFTGGRLGIIGRNGMGKSTLCDAVTGVLQGTSANRVAGHIHVYGHDVSRFRPHQIARLGVGYVPQGRRIFGSLTVDENLTVAARPGRWTVERVYELFPRLTERKQVGAGNLSGGEQQMLAIGRALVTQPRLLIMDEPSEGLAPVIVEHVIGACRNLADDGMDVLVVEQNLGVAVDMADELLVISSGRVVDRVESSRIANDSELQRKHLGFGTNVEDAETGSSKSD